MPVKKKQATKKDDVQKPVAEQLEIRKQKPPLWKRKGTYIVLAVIASLIGWYAFSRTDDIEAQYETYTVERKDLERTVEVTGEVKPSVRLNLAFERSGNVKSIHVEIGEDVTADQVLAELEDDDVQFAYRSALATLAAAQAKLDLEIAGAKTQTIQKAEAAVEQARANLTKAETDLQNTKETVQDNVRSAEIAVQTAKNTLNNQTTKLNQSVQDAYDDAIVTLSNTLGPMQTALHEGDKIIGVDDNVTNGDYEHLLGIVTSGSMERAEASYQSAKPVKEQAEAYVRSLTSTSSDTEIERAADAVLRALALIQPYLTDVQTVLSGSITGAKLTDAQLTTMKSAITNQHTTISTYYTNVQNVVQTITKAKLERTETIQSLEDQFETATINLRVAETNADTSVRSTKTNVAVKQAALRSAEADLDLLLSPPRSVDLEPLRAAVSEARVSLDRAGRDLEKIQIRAPIDGTISNIMPEIGERVTANEPIVTMLSDSAYDIEALVPESDVALVKIGQTVTITLDAFGDDVEFEGTVVREDPDQTVIQEAVYYKTRISVDVGERELKPGMSANVTILTSKQENVLVIPRRAVRTDDETNEMSVRIITSDDTIEERVVQLGLRGDEGQVAIMDGLREGETLIISERK